MKKLIAVIFVCSVCYGQSGLPYCKWGTVGAAWVADTMYIGSVLAPSTAKVRTSFIHDGGSAAADTLFIRFTKSTSDSGTGSNGRVIMLLGGQAVTPMLPVGRVIWFRKGSDSSVPFKVLGQVE